MNSIVIKATGPQPADGLRRTLLASRRHTLVFLAICMTVAVVSGLNANHGAAAGAQSGSNHTLQVYLFLIGMEWLWVRFVYKGMQARGRSPLEFIGERWFTPRQVAGDFVYAVLALGFSYFCFTGLLPHGQAVTNPLLPAVPSGAVGIIVWSALSVSAGICEEVLFRGYFQRQLMAISGSPSLAILVQAILFGIAHGYEGITAVIRIAVYGLALGMLAQWRGNIRAGILAHAAWDILAGLGLI